MPLEGLAALGLAANIIQVIDFSTKLLSSARQINASGSTVRNSDLELIAIDLKNTNEELRSCIGIRTTHETRDEQVCKNWSSSSDSRQFNFPVIYQYARIDIIRIEKQGLVVQSRFVQVAFLAQSFGRCYDLV